MKQTSSHLKEGTKNLPPNLERPENAAVIVNYYIYVPG